MDSELALKLAKDLRKAGSNIWMDQLNLKTGQRWDEAVEEALETCGSLLIILSPESVASRDVRDELAFALEENRPVFPVLYRDCKIPFRIRRIHYSNFSGDYHTGLQQLSKALNLKLLQSDDDQLQREIKITENKAEIKEKREGLFLGTDFKLNKEISEVENIPLQKWRISKNTPGGLELRSTPLQLSRDEANKVIQELDFFDSSINKQGKGMAHDYKLVARSGKDFILDNNTGLTWQQTGPQGRLTYKQAHAYIEDLNHKKYDECSNWRLPTLEEAMSLMEPEKNRDGLYINPIFGKSPVWFWTVDKKSRSTAWFISFSNGGCSYDHVDNDYAVRAVRSEQSFLIV